jgi:hypothetical protein
VRRAFAASPVRRASATWEAIVDVVAPEGSPGRGELVAVSGIAASLIAAESWRRAPAIVSGAGPQLRIYCLHDEDAITGEDASEAGLTWSPTDGDWTMEMPCPPDDLDWVATALADAATHVKVVDATVKRATEVKATRASAGPANGIDAEAFLRG